MKVDNGTEMFDALSKTFYFPYKGKVEEVFTYTREIVYLIYNGELREYFWLKVPADGEAKRTYCYATINSAKATRTKGQLWWYKACEA